MSYLYLKKSPPSPKSRFFAKKKNLAILLMVVGLFFFLSAIFPILKFQLQSSLSFSQMINPLSLKSYNGSQNILGAVTTDYTQINNWFIADSSDNNQLFSNDNNSTYKISIPKLKIKDAVVTIGSMDLKKSLIQYPQTALPGQLGNAVVFGHSVLPQFFNPKSYLTIFSTLYKLEQGDEIIIDYDSVQYKYIVDEMFEVKPTDLSVLEQRFDQKNLTLITCSPPGTYLRRLIIKSSLAVN
ncbi:MAG: sortase [Candidatus Shapirobacteria bacterium]|nr:sortase [Candidatus Shapirobacteria bacterium]MDD4410738.1 sortase [Candidatus Shapirobacteria bacterium]